MFGETTISYVKVWNHPIETTIYKLMFQVPGIYTWKNVYVTLFYGWKESSRVEFWSPQKNIKPNSASDLFGMFTLPETNIAPENRPFQKETSISTIHFQVRTVSFRECKWPFGKG